MGKELVAGDVEEDVCVAERVEDGDLAVRRDLGDALVARNEPGDLERAQEAYRQSLDMFTEMGAPGYIKVLEERLEDLKGVITTG